MKIAPHVPMMLILFVVGFLMMWIQNRHLAKNFLSPGQFRLVSTLGILSFLMVVFVAVKGLFPQL